MYTNASVDAIGKRLVKEVDLDGWELDVYVAYILVTLIASVQTAIMLAVWVASDFSLSAVGTVAMVCVVIAAVAFILWLRLYRKHRVPDRSVGFIDRGIVYVFIVSGLLIIFGLINAVIFLIFWGMSGFVAPIGYAALACAILVFVGVVTRYWLWRWDKQTKASS